VILFSNFIVGFEKKWKRIEATKVSL